MTAINEQNSDPARAVVAANDVGGDVEGAQKKLPYPKSVAFIISNEFCERFCYYGMRTILVLYLTRKLAYDDDTATVIYHVFTMLVYFMCTFGAILSDSWLGKFNTIMYLSILYAIGSIVIALGAIPPLNLPGQEMTILGLAIIALGSGGIKPCVAAFGGDQFVLPEQASQMAKFFSLFYFAINAGSFISTSVTPILRQDVRCFGDDDCYSLAFGVPGILMVISIFIFIFGKFMYKITPPSGNMVVLVSRCIGNAIATRWRESKFTKRDHWLEYAEPAYGKQLVRDTRILLNVLVLYIPLPVFWALFDQQGSRWTFQATRMDGDLGWYTIKPDQMQVVNPFMILVFIPMYEALFYPLLAKIGIRRPLQKLTIGGILAGVAFVCSGIVELQLESTYPVLPSVSGQPQLRLFNTLPCDYTVNTNLPDILANDKDTTLTFQLPAYGSISERFDYVGTFTYDMVPPSVVPAGFNCPNIRGTFDLEQAKAHSYFTANNGESLTRFEDDPSKTSSGLPALRVLANLPAGARVQLLETTGEQSVRYDEAASNRTRVVLPASVLQVRINGQAIGQYELRLGAVAVLLLSQSSSGQLHSSVLFLSEPNSVSMLWLLPQYIIMTLGEVMFSVTGLAFSYAQAPVSMKSVLQACWLLTVAFGNVIDIIIVGARAFDSQASEFFLFAGLMFVDMLLFMWLAHRYTPLSNTIDEEQETSGDELPFVEAAADATDAKKLSLSGIDNAAFTKEQTTPVVAKATIST